MKRKLFFLIPIMALVLLLSSCSLFERAFNLSIFNNDNISVTGPSSTSRPNNTGTNNTPQTNQSNEARPNQSNQDNTTPTLVNPTTNNNSTNIIPDNSRTNDVTPTTGNTTPTNNTGNVPTTNNTTPTGGETQASERSYDNPTYMGDIINSLTLETSNPTIDIDNIDDDLYDIKVSVNYRDGRSEIIGLTKDLMTSNNYYSLKFEGSHRVTVTYGNMSSEFSITTLARSWNVKFYNYDGQLISETTVRNNQEATEPEHPLDYYSNSKIYTFDKWDKPLTNITADTNITAEFKVKENISFECNTIVKSSSTVELNVSKEGTITSYSIKVKDSANNQKGEITNLNEETTITGLEASSTYTISGYYTFNVNNEANQVFLENTSFTTGPMALIETVNSAYEIDDEAISYDSLMVDLSSYIENTPDGYKLEGVALVDSSDNLVAEKLSNGNNIVFFDNLTPSTTYTTYFFYDKLNTTQLTAWTHEVSGNQYRYYFRGFDVQTYPNEGERKCVRIVYNDPDDGEILLYRYYVAKGSSVRQSTVEYKNPFSFRLPIKYDQDYIAVGDYKELENIEDDKTVSVLLFPISEKADSGEHLVVFVGNNINYIVDYEYVQDGGAANPPTVDYTIPEDRVGKHYEFTWKVRIGDSNTDINNIKKSTIFYPSYNEYDVLAEPTLSIGELNTQVGTDFFLCYNSFNTTTALISDSVESKLINTATNEEMTRVVFDKVPTRMYYKNLTPNTEYKYTTTYQYDINDNTGVHTKTFEFTFTTSSSTLDYFASEPTIVCDNYHKLTVTNSASSTADGVIFKEELDNYDFLYSSFYQNTAYREDLKTNTKYYIFSYKKETDGTVKYNRISSIYREFSTVDSVEPKTFRLQIHVSRNSRNEYVNYNGVTDNVRLFIDEFDVQKDIGTLSGGFYVFNPFGDFNGNTQQFYPLYFQFDSAKGYYVCMDYSFYYNYIYHESKQSDPETGQSYYMNTYIDLIHIAFFYNTSQTANSSGLVPQTVSNYNDYLTNYNDSDTYPHIKYEIIVH